MINGKTVLAIIPARGGSKRIPRKNLKSFRGRPLLQFSIESARASKYIDNFYVSSEDDEILQRAYDLGAWTMIRPDILATDDALNEAVLIDALHQLGNDYKFYDIIVLLQNTSPLRTGADIDACIEEAAVTGCCISVDQQGRRNGAVYSVSVPILLATLKFPETSYYEMPNARSIDIDYPDDLEK
jgi:CMP-N-acetylneuraminic acid synthetase